MRLLFSYSWDLPNIGLSEQYGQEFRFGEAQPLSDDLKDMFHKPGWLKDSNNDEE